MLAKGCKMLEHSKELLLLSTSCLICCSSSRTFVLQKTNQTVSRCTGCTLLGRQSVQKQVVCHRATRKVASESARTCSCSAVTNRFQVLDSKAAATWAAEEEVYLFAVKTQQSFSSKATHSMGLASSGKV